MERITKFRAWDSVQDKMLPVESIDFKNGLISLNEGDNSVTDTFDQFILMQFIGYGYEGEWNDRYRNMVELYEGDIVEARSEGSKGKFVVKYRDGAHPGYILWPAYQENKFWSFSFTDHNGKMFDDIKLIGNKYENPELLSVGKN